MTEEKDATSSAGANVNPTLLLLRRMIRGALGPLVGAVALFALPLAGALLLSIDDFAFWAILASISTVALSLDFGGAALLTARFFAEDRKRLLAMAISLSALGALSIGLIAGVAWALYSGTSLGSSLPLHEALLAIATMALAAAVRSALMVYAQLALIIDADTIRNLATAGHAFLASGITIAILIGWRTYWALPLGWLISGVAVLIPVSVMCIRRLSLQDSTPSISQPFRWGEFVSVRTLSTLLSATTQQGDRWVIGALGGPVLLAAYEIAWRFATLPRFLIQNLTIRVGADSSAMGEADESTLSALLRRSLYLSLAIAVIACTLVAIGYGAYTRIFDLPAEWTVLAAMLVAFTSLGVVSPYAFTGAAMGRGGIDIPYLVVILASSIIGVSCAVLLNNVLIFIFVYLGGVMLGALSLAAYAPRLILRSLANRTSPAE